MLSVIFILQTHSFCRLVATACWAFTIGGVRGWEDVEAMAQTEETPIQKLFIVNRFWVCFFMGLRKLSCCRNVSGWSFWNWHSLPVCCDGLGAQVVTYHAFDPLTSCLGQFCLLIMSFHVLACAYAIALLHKLIIWDSDCFLVCTSSVSLLCFSNQLTVTCSLERWPSLKPGLSDHITFLCSLLSILQSTQPYFAEYVNPYCLETGNQ